MAGKLPWMKLYTADWMTSERLLACSLAAQGLWLRMLCLMHNSDRRGYLCVHGMVPSLELLARMTGTDTAELSRLLTELETFGVLSATGDGMYYSRRMVREAQRSQKCSEAGKLGGRPRRNVETSKLKREEQRESEREEQRETQRGASDSDSSSLGFDVLKEEEEEELGKKHTREGGVGEGGGNVGNVGNAGNGVNGHAGGSGRLAELFPAVFGPQPVRRKPGRPRVDGDDPLFRRFWEAYPKRVAKQDALAAWARLGVTEELLGVMLAAVERHKATQWANGFIHNPATWLNGRRWEDEDVPPPAPAKKSPVDAIREARERIEAKRREGNG